MEIVVRSPQNKSEWDSYYRLRWVVLRNPWRQPEGSEKDQHENDAIHAAAFYKNSLVGIGRVNFEKGIAKIRFMATDPKFERRGVARIVLQYLEQKVKDHKVEKIQLNARASALQFYEKQGYKLIKKMHLLYDEIQHYLMEKDI